MGGACSEGGGNPAGGAASDAAVHDAPESSTADPRQDVVLPPPATEPTYAPTFTAIDREILAPSCALVFCHNGGLLVEFQSRETGYASLVGVPAEGQPCAPTGLLRVDPGNPERSLLYLKVTEPPCGDRMPLLYGTSGQLDALQIEQIRLWIERGALDD